MDRLVIVPDEKIESVLPILRSHLPAIADEVRAENLASLVGDCDTRLLLKLLPPTEQHEVMFWGRSERAFVMAWTSLGPDDELISAPTANLREGLVSRVFASRQPAIESAHDLHAATWTNIEEKRGRSMAGMAVAPVLLFGRCATALALVQFYSEAPVPSLSYDDLRRVAEAASLAGRLIEDRILRATLGLETW